jgi:glycosyltransferase involved in cell wall biosynthesis
MSIQSVSAMARAWRGKRIGILSPVAWRTPPRQYGAWETVASNIAEGLVRRGWDVTLFATADSITAARLHAVVPRGYEEDPALDPKVCEYLHIAECFEHAADFDLLHCHYDFMALTYSRLVTTPVVATIHGFSSPKIKPIYYKYDNVRYVSISESDRDPRLAYAATVYNGIDPSLHRFFPRGGEYLAFLGRIHPDKGTHLAAEVARQSGRKLLIAGIVQDRAYFETMVRPYIDGDRIDYIGAVGPRERNELFSRAAALLHCNELPERFGLAMAEANASGVPVIAYDRGSCREVIEDGVTGFLVRDVAGAVRALDKIHMIDRRACRARVERLFSLEAMVAGYERVYDRVFRRRVSRDDRRCAK